MWDKSSWDDVSEGQDRPAEMGYGITEVGYGIAELSCH